MNKVSEHGEQAAFVEYVLRAYQWREDFKRRLFFAVPNAAKRGYTVRNRMLAEGLTAGVFDVQYQQPRGPYSGLAIEMKVEGRRGRKNGGMSDVQVEYFNQAVEAGLCADVCYSSEEAIKVFDDYMKLEVGYGKSSDTVLDMDHHQVQPVVEVAAPTPTSLTFRDPDESRLDRTG